MVRNAIKKITIPLYRLSTAGLDKGPHITRYSMYNRLSTHSRPRDKSEKVLSISNSMILGELLGYKEEQIFDAEFPEYNIFKLPFSDGEFDAVVSDQVLEHVEGNPQSAIDETFRVLKRDGIALHTTCFYNPIHGCPGDYWRFTPEGLRLLASRHGDVIDVGGWGNPYAYLFFALGFRYLPIPNAPWHPANWIAKTNDALFPITTWVFAKKRAE